MVSNIFMKNNFYLKPNILAEPLVDQWYAQPLLIPPTMAALLTVNTHLPIMLSYITDPQAHEAALEWPEMQGGPFIDYPERQVAAIELLLNETKIKRAKSIQLANAIKELAHLLEERAQGHALSEFYDKLPVPLKGYIELGYDLMSQPVYRFFESLLYDSEYSLENGQTVLLSEILSDTRPFCLSTPRLITPDMLNVKLPFKSDWYDRFFAARLYPISNIDIEELFQAIPNHSELVFEKFKQLFFIPDTQRSAASIPSEKDQVRIRYIGHACLLFETAEVSIITDVSLGYFFPNCSPRYSYSDLPEKIDYLLITHTHQDHIQIEHLLQLRHRIDTVIVPNVNAGVLRDPSLKLMFKALGFKKIIGVDDLETVTIPNGSITSIPFMGEHGDLDIKGKSAYAVRLNNLSILCLADANAIDKMVYQHVHSIIGNMDLLFLSMECEGAPMSWLYNAFQLKGLSWEADQSRRLDASNYEKALAMIKIFNCKEVYIYGMGQESWLCHIMNIALEIDSIQQLEMQKLEHQCKKMGIDFEILYNQKEILRR
jgi:L-ascorbate metabolism protein UlaG (beta-lactamase superfamily)